MWVTFYLGAFSFNLKLYFVAQALLVDTVVVSDGELHSGKWPFRFISFLFGVLVLLYCFKMYRSC